MPPPPATAGTGIVRLPPDPPDRTQAENCQLSQVGRRGPHSAGGLQAGNAKIDAALNEAEAREAGDAALTALLKRCLCTTSYQGNGDTRQPSTTVTFPARPLVVIVSGPEQYLFVTYGSSWGIGEVKNTIQNIDIPCSFNGNSLTFTHTQYIQKYTYKVFAILQP